MARPPRPTRSNPRPAAASAADPPAKPHRPRPGLPSRQEVLDFIAASPTPVGKREIARAFKVQPADRVALKGLIKDIERAGIVERGHGRRFAPLEALPEIAVLEVTGLDSDGLPMVRPLGPAPDDPIPQIRLSETRGDGTVAVGERVIARLRRKPDANYDASIIRKIGNDSERVLGVFSAERDGGGHLNPTDRRNKTVYRIRPAETLGAQEGELVLAEPLPIPRLGLPHVQVVERLGPLDDPRSISLIAIHTHGIPVAFPSAAVLEAERAAAAGLGDRADLRAFPLITIDGADARDFDDAVFAEPDPNVAGGWHLLVAIADVSWYVRPGTPLDIAARERGNSVYFPDRVVPMLPEALSNELCSLKPNVDRACLAMHLWIDAKGRLTRHQVVRGLMRSTARLTYEQVQAAMDGRADALTDPLLEPVLKPLYAAYAVLEQDRAARGTLDLDLPEWKVNIASDGRVASITRRDRLTSHKLIEEFMIAANVAAAEALEAARQPCMYRVHDVPDPAKLEALGGFLENLGIPGVKLARGQTVRPANFNRILGAVIDRPESALINEMVLRSQAQATYAPANIGHFGLALMRYAHFTSPIRRYADLVVHRALVSSLKLAVGGLPSVTQEEFEELGDHLSKTERRAGAAERTATDRYMVAHMADRVGASFTARVNGVTRFGLFVTLKENGADGLIPIGTLPMDYYHHDAQTHRLTGQRHGRVFTIGDTLEVRLEEANPVAGGLRFALIDSADNQPRGIGRPKLGPGRARHPGKSTRSRKPGNPGPRQRGKG